MAHHNSTPALLKDITAVAIWSVAICSTALQVAVAFNRGVPSTGLKHFTAVRVRAIVRTEQYASWIIFAA